MFLSLVRPDRILSPITRRAATSLGVFALTVVIIRPRRNQTVPREKAPCACRKPKSQRIGDAARQPGRATRYVRFAESGERPAHPGPMTGVFSPYCNSEHTLAGSDAERPQSTRSPQGRSPKTGLDMLKCALTEQ